MRRARKSIAAFKLREGMPVGVAVTLRGERGYEFLDRLMSIAIPRIRDFRGLNPRSFDGRGNYSMGVREQIIFPEIDYDAIDQVRGLDITITTIARRPTSRRTRCSRRSACRSRRRGARSGYDPEADAAAEAEARRRARPPRRQPQAARRRPSPRPSCAEPRAESRSPSRRPPRPRRPRRRRDRRGAGGGCAEPEAAAEADAGALEAEAAAEASRGGRRGGEPTQTPSADEASRAQTSSRRDETAEKESSD